jgi:hypothetical protein
MLRALIRNVLAHSDRSTRSRTSEEIRGDALVAGWEHAPPSTAPSPSAPNALEQYFDAVTDGPGIWKWRHYFDAYQRHLHRFVGRKPVVVEIGGYSGGSLAMWHSYFGEGTHVHGIDIEAACRVYASPHTTIHIGDQADAQFWKYFTQQVPQVDVLVDDGGHEPEQQIATLEAMLPHLRPGGVYICEDVTGTDNRFSAFVRALMDGMHAYTPTCTPTGNTSPATSFQSAIQSMHVYPFVVVIEKRPDPLLSFSGPKHGTQWQPHL